MFTINVADLPILTAEDAEYETGIEAYEFAEPGLYRVLFGSRGEIDEMEFMGNVATFDLPTLEEVSAELQEEWGEYADDVEEFYGHELTERGYEFGYTEEGYDVFIRIG